MPPISSQQCHASVCMICLQLIPVPAPVKSESECEPLDRIFQVFCDYMNLSKTPAPVKSEFGSFKSQLPFCETCIQQVLELYGFHEQKEKISGLISKLVRNFSAMIMENPVQSLEDIEILLIKSEGIDGEEREGVKDASHCRMKLVDSGLGLPLLLNDVIKLRKEVIARYSVEVLVQKSMNLPLKATFDQPSLEEFPQPADAKEQDISGEYLSNLEDTNDEGLTDIDEMEFDNCEPSCDTSDDDYEVDKDEEGDEDDMDYVPGLTTKPRKNAKKAPVVAEKESYRQTSGKRKKGRPMKSKQIGPNQFSLDGFTYEKAGEQYKCGSCVYIAKRRARIYGHVKKVHVESAGRVRNKIVEVAPDKFILANQFTAEKVFETYKCGTCDYMTETRANIKAHLREHLCPKEARPKTRMCETCGKSFCTSSALRSHIRTHSEERRYQCEVCAKSYKGLGGLKIHMETHTGEDNRRFICEVCGYKARFAKKLHYHMSKHVRQQIYQCDQCDKKYSWEKALDFHKRCHDPKYNTRVYSCDYCDMKFSSRSSIPRHIRVIHNGEKSSQVFRRAPKTKTSESEGDQMFPRDVHLPSTEVYDPAISDLGLGCLLNAVPNDHFFAE